MDTKFSVAVHVLILISEAPGLLNSEQMAVSVGTNASYIRKVLARLKRSGIVDGHRGIGGYTLTTAPDKLTMLRIYQSVMGDADTHLLDIHRNPGDKCIVGRYIRPTLSGMFKGIEEAFARALDGKTLTDCIVGIREAAGAVGESGQV